MAAKKKPATKNPGAQTLPQWLSAVGKVCKRKDQLAGNCSRSNDAETKAAVKMIRDTPASRRRQFGQEQRAMRRANGRGRKNPSPAAELYADFHGKAPTRSTVIEQRIFSHDELADLGALIDLQVIIAWDGDEAVIARIDFTNKQVRVAAAGNRTELHFVGGNQTLDLRKLGAADQDGKPTIFIGELWKICYFTSKDFHDFKPSKYEHELGEDDDGTRPHLNYDPRSKLMFLTGGSYVVERPGIIN